MEELLISLKLKKLNKHLSECNNVVTEMLVLAFQMLATETECMRVCNHVL